MNADAEKFKKFYCGRFLLDLKFCPLENNFAPLATHSEIPILAGETLYPSAEHYIAAQLFRDVGRLEASKNVPKIRSQQQLRQYVRVVLGEIDEKVVNDWRHTKMLSALKTATQMKFSQYAELKALLVQTGATILIETNENDVDWGVGMSFEKLKTWMRSESLNVSSIAFWLMHCDFKPGLLGANLSGRLLMTLRNEFVMELDKEFKPKLDADVYVCHVCSNLEQYSQIFETEPDEIMFINAPQSVLAFNYPCRFMINGKVYSSVESFVLQQITDALTVKWSSKLTLDERTIENELYGMFQEAVGANLQQNRFVAEALLRTKNALLVDVRPSLEQSNLFVSHLATSLGAFRGGFDDFVTFVDKNGLNSQTLARWWFVKDVPMLKSIGKNRLGVLMMKFREKLTKNEIQPLSDETFLSNFRPYWATASKPGLFQALIRTPDFVTSDKICIIPKIDPISPLSKIYCCFFTVDKTEFISLEHYFWWRRMLNVASRGFLRKILSTNSPNELRELCEIYLASNTPVVDEDQISDTEIYEFGCLEKFQQNCLLSCVLVEDLSLLIDGTDAEIQTFEKYVYKWSIPAKLLIRWYSNEVCNKDFPKPVWLPENTHGLTLMKVRQIFLNKHYDAYFTDENFFVEEIDHRSLLSVEFREIDKNRFFIFSDDHALNFRSSSTNFNADGDDYRSINHYYWSKCLEQLGFLTESQTLLSVESEQECRQFVDELFESFSLHELYKKWQTTEEMSTLKTALRLCLEFNKRFRNALRQTVGLTLIYENRNDAFDENWSIAMSKVDFVSFITDLNLNAQSFLALYSDPSSKPKCLGRNLWAFMLMEVRVEEFFEKQDDIVEDFEFDRSCLFEITSIPSSNFDERCQVYDSKDTEGNKFRISQCYWDALVEPFATKLIKTEAIPHETAIDIKQKSTSVSNEKSSVDKALDKKKSALFAACRQCFPNFTDMVGLLKNEQEAFELGQQFAHTFRQMFGDEFDQALKVLNVEDLHSLGRIAGFEQNVP